MVHKHATAVSPTTHTNVKLATKIHAADPTGNPHLLLGTDDLIVRVDSLFFSPLKVALKHDLGVLVITAVVLERDLVTSRDDEGATLLPELSLHDERVLPAAVPRLEGVVHPRAEVSGASERRVLGLEPETAVVRQIPLPSASLDRLDLRVADPK